MSVGAKQNSSQQLFPQGFIVMLVLWLLVVVSAVGLVWNKHVNRSGVAQLQQLYKERDELKIEWTQLLLEQSTLGALNRIEMHAVETLNMHTPGSAELVIVRR